ncbi:MAG TPA: TonB family protein [Polyangia bacterium]|nr:TonB family protein [Polyangia bacterium]
MGSRGAALVVCLLQAQAQPPAQFFGGGPPGGDGGVADAAPPTAPVDGGQPVVTPPALTHFVPAVYPPEAEAAGVAGSVTFSIVIDETGKVGAIKVLDPGPHPKFAAAAEQAVKQFQFSPAVINGKPTAVEIEYRYEFVLHKQPPPPPSATESPVSLIGRVVERGTRSPVVAASIEAGGVTTETNDDGRFTLRGLPVGPVKVQLVSSAHHDLAVDEVIEPGKVKEVEYRMNRRRYGQFEAVVRGQRERKEVAVHEITAQEIATIPGTQGDVLKVLQDFPGVARAPFGLGLLIVRGSAPQDTKVYMDGVEIPLIFHFGALTAVVNSDVISGLDFYPGNFATNYGNAMGGTIDVRTRDPKHEWHGAGHVDLYDGAAMVEGPVGNGSFFVSVRRSWVDEVLKLALPSGLTVAPVFWDYQAKYVHALWGGQGTLFWYGSSDALNILDENTARKISFDSEIQFHRLAARWQRGFAHSWRNDAILSLGYTDTANEVVNAVKLDGTLWTVSLRDTLSWRPSEKVSLEMGTDSSLRHLTYDISLPRLTQAQANSAFGTGGLNANPSQNSSATTNWAQPGFFATLTWLPTPRLRLQPGVRFDASSDIQNGHAWWFDPRLSGFYTISPSTVLKGAVGLYSQAPQPQDLIPSLFGNPNLTYQRSLQYSVGINQKLPYQLDLELSLYDKYMWRLETPTRLTDPMGAPLYTSNLGKGRSYGLELLLRRQIVKGFYGWIAYTLSRSTRLDDPSEPTYQYGWHLFDFDQTHILTVIASYQTEHNWTFGTRVRYVSGDPFTPYVNGIFNANSGSYVCITGNPNSDRAPPFFQADVRIDRRFVYDNWIFTGYLDVQNVTNRQNPEAIFPNYNCNGYATLTGLPIFPTIGLRAEF